MCRLIAVWTIEISKIYIVTALLTRLTGWPRHKENGEFGSYFFQTWETRNFVWTVYLHTVSVYSCVIFIWDMKQTGVGEGCNFEVIIFH